MTEKAKHTPGSWEVFNGYDGSLSVSATKPVRINNISAGTPVICDVYPHSDADGFSGEANARLIAAAPELLEALKKLASVDFGSNGWNDFAESAAREAREAIAKALGEK